MARFWSPVYAALAALATGASGTGRTVPAATLRSDLYPVEPGSPEYPVLNVDRTVQILPRAGGHANTPIENQFTVGHRTGLVDLIIAYDYELPLAEVPTAAGESTTSVARARAADDIEVVMRALLWPANYSTLANGITIMSIEPAGDWRLDDAGNGTLLLTQPLRLRVSVDPMTTWDVGA